MVDLGTEGRGLEGHSRAEALAFIAECPATPLSHLLGGAEKLAKEPGRPVQVTAYVTRACNLRCVHCYIRAGEPLKDEMTTDEWKRVFAQLRDLGTEDLYILGGEPMMRGDIYELVAYAARLGLRASLSTNGTLIGSEEARRLADAGLAEAQVSIDGPTAPINDMIRVPGSFNRAIKAVRYLRDAGIRVTLGYVVTPLNYRYVLDFLRLAEELGVDAVTFEAVVTFGRAADNGLRLSRDIGTKVVKELLSYRGPVNINFSSMRFYLPDLLSSYRAAIELLGPRARAYTTCPAGTTRMVIDANGDVYGCELFIPLGVREGNVRTADLSVIWRDGFSWIRSRASGVPEQCRSCPMAPLCRGGCPARAMAYYGTPWAPDPLCPLASFGSKTLTSGVPR